MPKFYCHHCLQHIDAADELAGSQASCPTCGGEIKVPALGDPPTQAHEPEATQKKKNSRWKSYVKYTLVAYGILCFGECAAPYGKGAGAYSLARHSTSSAFAISFGALQVIAVAAITAGSVIAAIAHFAFKKDFHAWLHGVYITLVLVFSSLMFFDDISGNKTNAKNTTRVIWSESDETGVWNSTNLFGINIFLPGYPKTSKISAPLETKHLIKNGFYDQAIVRDDDYEVAVARIERNSSVLNLDEIRSGIINDIKNLDVVSNVRVITGEMIITERKALWSEVYYSVDGREWCNRSLIFADGGTLWMVSITGDGDKTNRAWHKIRDSVTIGIL
jgi:hypothetical protein